MNEIPLKKVSQDSNSELFTELQEEAERALELITDAKIKLRSWLDTYLDVRMNEGAKEATYHSLPEAEWILKSLTEKLRRERF